MGTSSTEQQGTGAESAKERIRARAQEVLPEVLELSHAIHAEPEVAFQERRTAQKATAGLEGHGFTVQRGLAGLETAFVATYGSGPMVIGFCAELDALPEVGHACGHNVIAAAGVLAGLSLAAAAEQLGVTVKVFGTPAEEFGGGKIFMLRAGAFDDVHAAMMVHPGADEHADHLTRAVVDLEVTYTGKPAHSAEAPHEGINAGDAATVAQVAIGLLRQHLRPGELVHGVLTEAGGAPNVVPAHAHLVYDARAETIAQLEEPGGAKDRLIRCFQAGALATGASVEIKDEWPAFSEFRNDQPMVSAYRANAQALGRVFDDFPLERRRREAGSTDMANVSLQVPSIHPTLNVFAGGATCHQPEFARYCILPGADQAVHDGGVGLAWTAADMAGDPDQRQRLFRARQNRQDTGAPGHH